MKTFTRRAVLAGAGAVAGAAAVVALREVDMPVRNAALAAGDGATVLDDASELSAVRVAKHVTLSRAPDEALIAALRTEIAEARRERRAVAASAARHSMGGQSLPRGGTAITLEQDAVELDTAASIFRVAAGARWNSIIPALDAAGFSPAVMQSNNDFGVASTFCVNAHGWPAPYGPFGSTVRSFRLMNAGGEILTCSRNENPEVFAATMGGYGLTGIILDLDVEMVPNLMLEPRYEVLAAEEFGPRFASVVEEDADLRMAYGRLDVTKGDFLGAALMITYRPLESDAPLPAASGSGFVSHVSRAIYRSQPGSDRMKRLRWWMETDIGPWFGGRATRNSLMNEPAATLADRDPGRTDILHEYFVPPEAFAGFIAACRDVIPRSYQELLNVTLRYVRRDDESLLSYARTPRIAAVMSFTQEKSERAEHDMMRMTRALIDRVLELGGSYYLPYRLHASDAQLERAYPKLRQFVARKRELDPVRLFRNALWDRYMEDIDA